MDKLFLTAFEFTKANEGGFSDHPSDPGGKTLFGVSVIYFPIQYYKIYSAWKSGDKKLLSELLHNFYYKEFWNPKYELLSDKTLAIRLFDLSVNLGKKTAVRLLQTAINQCCNKNVTVDGIFGVQTLGVCNFLYKQLSTEEEPLYEEFIEVVERYYRTRKNFNVFGKGWLARLNREIKYEA